MGRLTWESIGSKPLKDRKNIVLSKTPKPNNIQKDVIWIDDINKIKSDSSDDQLIIGGSKIIELLIDNCDFGFLTIVDSHLEGDTKINLNQILENFKIIESFNFIKDEKNEFSMEFLKLIKK